jgi:glycosyl hydrolase family 26
MRLTLAAAASAAALLILPPTASAGDVALGAYIPGATEHAQRIDAYARKTGRRPAIVMYYRSWERGQVFDRRTLHSMTSRGALPMITWEPQGHPLGRIAAGDYDDYLRESAADARRWGRTILVRFAHEMNGDWYDWGTQQNSPDDFVAAWRHVVSVFRGAGAGNVRWLWSPNVDYGGTRLLRRLYPGDRYVDWVGLDGFSWGGPWEWQSVKEIFERSYRAITAMTWKPVIISETAAGELGGDKRKWIDDAFARDLPKLPRVKAVVWFNGKDKWAKWDVDSTPGSLRAFRAAVSSPRYAADASYIAALSRPPWCCGGWPNVGRRR